MKSLSSYMSNPCSLTPSDSSQRYSFTALYVLRNRKNLLLALHLLLRLLTTVAIGESVCSQSYGRE